MKISELEKIDSKTHVYVLARVSSDCFNHRKTRFGKNDHSKSRNVRYIRSPPRANSTLTRHAARPPLQHTPTQTSTRLDRTAAQCQVVGVEDRQSPLVEEEKRLRRRVSQPAHPRIAVSVPSSLFRRVIGSLVETVTLAKRSRVGVDDRERKRALDSSEGARRKMVEGREGDFPFAGATAVGKVGHRPQGQPRTNAFSTRRHATVTFSPLYVPAVSLHPR